MAGVKRPRSRGARAHAQGWGSKKKSKSGPTLPRSLMREMGYQEADKSEKKQVYDGQRARQGRSTAPRAKQPGDPLSRSLQEGIQSELQLQATLAKKLKLKKGQTRTGPEDGLDGLLKGLESYNGVAPDGSAAQEQKSSDEEDAMVGDQPWSDDGEDASLDDDEDSEDVDDVEEEAQAGADPRTRVQLPPTDEDSTNSESEESDSQLVNQQPAGQQERDQDTAAGISGKYVPPAARQRAALQAQGASHDATGAQDAADGPEHAATARKVTSLLNRAAAANLPKVASELADVFNSAPSHIVVSSIVTSIMQAVEEGPRAADQFAAVTACLVIMTAALASMQRLVASTLLALAAALEQARASEDSIAASNVTHILCFLYACKGIDGQLVYSLLETFKASMTDGDAHLTLLLLQNCGSQLHTDDAAALKAFLEGVEADMAAMAAAQKLSQRARLMLELVVGLKNSKKLKKTSAGLQSHLPADVLKQLHSCNVSSVALHSLAWKQLIEGEHKGAWWLPYKTGEQLAEEQPLQAGRQAARERGDAVMQLAMKQRMNTDSRRAIFCILMSAEDYMDAFEKLLRLPLKGAADRDTAYVVVHCCLQEEKWNPYYALVATELARAAKVYKMSLQFATQDRLRQIQDLNPRQASNLAELLAHLLAQQALPLLVFKVLDLEQPSKRVAIVCKMCLQRLLRAPKATEDLVKVFAALQQERVKTGLLGLVKRVLRPWAAGLPDSGEAVELRRRVKAVEKVLRTAARPAGWQETREVVMSD